MEDIIPVRPAGGEIPIDQASPGPHLASMRVLASLSGLLVASTASAQLPELPARATSTAGFIPTGYRILKEVAGHLNGDEYRDLVLILSDARERPDSILGDTRPRLLLVLAGEPSGFRLDVATDRAVLGRREGGAFGDPLESLDLDRNVIVVTHYGGSAWRWRLIHRFRFQQNGYRLVGRTITKYFNGAYCERLKEYRPTTHLNENLATGHRYRYEVPEQRCVKRERRTRFTPIRTALLGFDLSKEIDDR